MIFLILAFQKVLFIFVPGKGSTRIRSPVTGGEVGVGVAARVGVGVAPRVGVGVAAWVGVGVEVAPLRVGVGVTLCVGVGVTRWVGVGVVVDDEFTVKLVGAALAPL
jgi:hypothetical protein